MTAYEIIQNQSKEVLADTISDYVAMTLMASVMYGVPTDIDFIKKQVAESLDSEDIVSNAERKWKLHPDGFGQYCLDMANDEIKRRLEQAENKVMP